MRGKARVTEADIKDMMREIRMALLEADVNYGVVKEFVAEMSEKCKGADVTQSLTPGQEIVKIVRGKRIVAERKRGGGRGHRDICPEVLHIEHAPMIFQIL